MTPELAPLQEHHMEAKKFDVLRIKMILPKIFWFLSTQILQRIANTVLDQVTLARTPRDLHLKVEGLQHLRPLEREGQQDMCNVLSFYVIYELREKQHKGILLWILRHLLKILLIEDPHKTFLFLGILPIQINSISLGSNRICLWKFGNYRANHEMATAIKEQILGSLQLNRLMEFKEFKRMTQSPISRSDMCLETYVPVLIFLFQLAMVNPAYLEFRTL